MTTKLPYRHRHPYLTGLFLVLGFYLLVFGILVVAYFHQ